MVLTDPGNRVIVFTGRTSQGELTVRTVDMRGLREDK